MDMKRGLDVAYISALLKLLTFIHNSPADKRAKYGPDTQKLRWIENCQRSWAQRVVNRGAKPRLNGLTSGVLRVNAELILHKNAISNGENETEFTQGNFMDNTKLGGLQIVLLPFRGSWASWLKIILLSSTKAKNSFFWGGIVPSTSTCWGRKR